MKHNAFPIWQDNLFLFVLIVFPWCLVFFFGNTDAERFAGLICIGCVFTMFIVLIRPFAYSFLRIQITSEGLRLTAPFFRKELKWSNFDRIELDYYDAKDITRSYFVVHFIPTGSTFKPLKSVSKLPSIASEYVYLTYTDSVKRDLVQFVPEKLLKKIRNAPFKCISFETAQKIDNMLKKGDPMCELKLSGNRFVMQRAAVFEFIEVCIIITALIVLLAFLKKILVVTAMAAIIALMLFLFFKGRGLKTEFGREEIVVQKVRAKPERYSVQALQFVPRFRDSLTVVKVNEKRTASFSSWMIPLLRLIEFYGERNNDSQILSPQCPERYRQTH